MRDPSYMVGKTFGKLSVTSRADNYKHYVMWNCRCECGNEIVACTADLNRGHTKSCGCMRNERIAKLNYSHGGCKDRLYGVWLNMRTRCYNPRVDAYKYYGGRGIKICDEWQDYAIFRNWAIANGYDESAPHFDCTIDRIDVNGDYSPDNCRWVDMAQQNTNKRKRQRIADVI